MFPATARRGLIRNLLVSDVDDTLLGDNESLARFVREASLAEGFRYALNSSRPVESVRKTLKELPVALKPVAIIGAMGTEILIDGENDDSWQNQFTAWDRSVIDRLMLSIGARPHDAEFQTRFKASYAVPPDRQSEAREYIDRLGQRSFVVASGADDFDVLPHGAGKGVAILRCLELLDVSVDRLVVAGDSANDLDMFVVARKGILVGNARSELRNQVDHSAAYQASQPFAAGVLEGLRHWGIQLPVTA